MKRDIIDGYVRWMRRLGLAMTTGYRGVRLLERPTRFSTLAHLHALVPGPDWIGDCLVNAERVRVHRTVLPHPPWTFEHDPDEMARIQSEAFTAEPSRWPRQTNVVLARCQYRTVRRLRVLDARLGALYDSPSWPTGPVRTVRAWSPVGHTLLQVPRAALSCWRTTLEPLLPDPDDPGIDGDGLVHEDAQWHWLWQSWREGPGRLRRCESTVERQGERDGLVDRVGELWSEQMLAHLFTLCVARAVVLPAERIYTWSIPEAVSDLGGMPVVALRRWRAQLFVAVATTLPPEQRIERLLHRHFLGTGANEPLTAKTVADLHELVGIHPEVRERTARQLQEGA